MPNVHVPKLGDKPVVHASRRGVPFAVGDPVRLRVFVDPPAGA